MWMAALTQAVGSPAWADHRRACGQTRSACRNARQPPRAQPAVCIQYILPIDTPCLQYQTVTARALDIPAFADSSVACNTACEVFLE